MNEQRTARPAGAGARRRSPVFTRQAEPERTVLSPVEEEIANALTNAVDERIDRLCAYDPRLSRLPLLAALASGVHDAAELAALAGAVRALPAA